MLWSQDEEAQPRGSFKQELGRAQCEDGVLCRTHIGGQALIEGIMMRGRYNWAVAVRQPDGQIHLEEHDLASGRDKNSWMYKPIIRGCTAFVESLALGYKALDVSAQYAYDFEEDEAKSAEKPAEEPVAPVEKEESGRGNGLSAAETTFAMVMGVVLGLALFIVVPAVLTNLIVGDYGSKGTLLWNLVDGILRIMVFIFYIWLIGRMKDIKRMFSYHGAEHKTIHCFEHGLELTPGNAATFPTLHVRCGTAFLIMTMIIAILVFTLVPVNLLVDWWGVDNRVLRLLVVILSRIILLPLVAGLAYEVTVKWAGSRPENKLVKVVLWPGMQMQRLTTNQPDEGMLECAIAAMKLVIAREEAEAAKKAAAEGEDLEETA